MLQYPSYTKEPSQPKIKMTRNGITISYPNTLDPQVLRDLTDEDFLQLYLDQRKAKKYNEDLVNLTSVTVSVHNVIEKAFKTITEEISKYQHVFPYPSDEENTEDLDFMYNTLMNQYEQTISTLVGNIPENIDRDIIKEIDNIWNPKIPGVPEAYDLRPTDIETLLKNL